MSSPLWCHSVWYRPKGMETVESNAVVVTLSAGETIHLGIRNGGDAWKFAAAAAGLKATGYLHLSRIDPPRS